MGLLFDPDAFDNIPPHEAKNIKKKIDWLWENRSDINHHPLRGDLSGYLKRRLGNYRILYSYNSTSDDMIVHLVGLRDSIYRNASES